MRKFLFALAVAGTAVVSASATDWYLTGTNYGNWGDVEEYKFTPTAEAGVQTLEVAELSGEFKIKKGGSWDAPFGSNGSQLVEGETYSADGSASAGNITVDGAIKNATITIDENVYTILVKGEASEIEYDAVYVVGDFGSGWSEANTDYPMTLTEGSDSEWTGTFTLPGAINYFKLKAGSNVYGPTEGSDMIVAMGLTYDTVRGANCAYVLGTGTYDFTYTLPKNAAFGKLVVTKHNTEVAPDALYIVGTVEGEPYDAGVFEGYGLSRLPMTETATAGVYECEAVINQNENWGDYGFFMFMKGDKMYVPGTYDQLESGVTYTLEETDSADLSYIEPGTYTVTVNMNTMELTMVNNTPVVKYYLRGEINNWEASEDYLLTENRLGTYTLSIPELSGEFKIADANWTDEYTYTSLVSEMDPGMEYVLYTRAQGEEYVANMGTWGAYKDVTVYFDPNTRMFSFEGTKVDDPVVDNALFIIGSIDGGTLDEMKSVELEKTAEGVFEGSVNVNPAYPVALDENGEMMMYPGVISVYYGEEFFGTEEGMVFIGVENDLIQSDGINQVSPGTYNIVVDMNAKTIFLEDVTEYPELYLRGDINDWGTGEEYKFQNIGEGTFVLDLPKLQGDFKIANEDWSIAYTSNVDNMEVEAPYTLSTMGGNMRMANRLNETEIVYLYNYNVIIVYGEIDDTPVVKTYTLDGSFTGADWASYVLTKAEDSGVYSAQVEVTEPVGNFLVKEYAGDVVNAYWKSNGTEVLNTETPEIQLYVEGLTSETLSDASYDFSGAEAKTITFFFNPETGKVSASWNVGVEGIGADEEEAEYYNLQGVRIDRPEKGLCIKVQNGKATRVLVK